MTSIGTALEPVVLIGVSQQVERLEPSRVRQRNLSEVKRVASEVQYVQTVRLDASATPFWIVDEDASTVSGRCQREVVWTLWDEDNTVLDQAGHLVSPTTRYRAIFDGKWHVVVEGVRRGYPYTYGIIHEFVNRALGYAQVVDKVLASEKARRGERKASRRIRRLMDWMIQDCEDLRVPCSSATFRGLFSMLGVIPNRATVNDVLSDFGMARYADGCWIEVPPFPIPVPIEPRDRLDSITDWQAYADSLDGTADAWAGRAFCPVCHTVNTTRPFCVVCGIQTKLTHSPIQLSDLRYQDWR